VPYHAARDHEAAKYFSRFVIARIVIVHWLVKGFGTVKQILMK
jgi:hypothetical protein